MKSLECKVKRTVVARFDEGEDLLESIEKCAIEHGIPAGTFSIIGGLKKISYGLLEKSGHRRVEREAAFIFEILSVSGNISMKEGRPFVHAHIIVADVDDKNRVYGGHLERGSIITPFTEVIIHEFDQKIGRKYDEKLGLWALDL